MRIVAAKNSNKYTLGTRRRQVVGWDMDTNLASDEVTQREPGLVRTGTNTDWNYVLWKIRNTFYITDLLRASALATDLLWGS